jgi:hemolysin D
VSKDTTASTQPQRHPARDLLSKYSAIFQAAWQHRAELAGPARLADEAAFLPAALSLQDTPVHPAPRRFALAIMALFVIALVWSIFGKVDIVATAPGRIIVSDRTKVIQPLEASVVRRVLVKDGDRVQAGQVLVELDPTMASADKASVQEQLNAAASEAYRTQALQQLLLNTYQTIANLRGLEADLIQKSTNSAKNASNIPKLGILSTSAATQSQLQSQLLSEWRDISARLAKLDAEAVRRQAEIQTVMASIAKLQATLPMAQTREADFKNLVGEGFISSHATQDKTRERVELERDLVTQQARLMEAKSTLAESQQTRAAFKAETQRLLNDRHAVATSKLQQLTQEGSKAAQRERQTQLTAPVAGIVQQLAIHSVGGVVTSAQPLMIVVPDSIDGTKEVTAEISIANQDIGFVNAGQMAEVKLETFPYTKYGTVKAKVNIVTADAVTDEKKGSYYPATITLNQKDMLIDGKRVKLSPGMNITAEIKTGQRRVIEYLLSPVQRAGAESLRER